MGRDTGGSIARGELGDTGRRGVLIVVDGDKD
jgi:hypothetical protein